MTLWLELQHAFKIPIREACGHFRRPRKKKLQHSESGAATKQTQALYWFRLPDFFQMWFETTRFVYFVKLKHASRTFFNLKLQRTAFHSKNAPKSAPRAHQELPKRLQSASGSSPETSREATHTSRAAQERPRYAKVAKVK